MRHNADFAAEDLFDTVRAEVPESQLFYFHGNELAMSLPHDSHGYSSYNILFDKLDKKLDVNKDILDYGVSTSSLEQIFYSFFLKESNKDQRDPFTKNKLLQKFPTERNVFQEFKALVKLRFVKKSNDLSHVIINVFLPFILLLAAVFFVSGDNSSGFTLSSFNETVEEHKKGDVYFQGKGKAFRLDIEEGLIQAIDQNNSHIFPYALEAFSNELVGTTKITIGRKELQNMALTFDNEVAMTFVVGVSFAFFPAALNGS